MASLEEIRRRLAEQENKRNTSNNNEGEGPVYPHWNINDGDTAIVRFLEDANADNPYFWVERLMFKFPFNGIKGDPSAGKVIVQVPCMEMYGEKDPVLDEVREWFKADGMDDMGRTYWKKRTFIYQGFVRSDPMDPEGAKTPENPIRRFMIGPQIHNLIKNSLMDPELENLPTDPIAGLDFRILKTTKGGYGDYTTSTWSRKESSLTEEEAAAIEKYGLSNLADFLPPKPTEEVQKVIQEMFEASVNGEAYDPARWGSYFTPPGMARTGNDNATESKPAETTATADAQRTTADLPANNAAEAVEAETPAEPVAENVAEPEAVTVDAGDDGKDAKTKKILEMIRKRSQ